MAKAKMLMKGNHAVAEAAIRAGCRFFAGYPITPQSEIPEYMSSHMPAAGGTFVQTESEIAGISMVFGAGACGARAMTSSSGPGFSLMQEGISYMVSAQVPAVIVDMTRYGSGLGDINPNQADYNQLAKNGGHGDYHCIVLSPGSLQEAVDAMGDAFSLAEKYRNPVIVACDGSIGQMVEAVDFPEPIEHDIDQFDWASITHGAAITRRSARPSIMIFPFRNSTSSAAKSLTAWRAPKLAGSPFTQRTRSWFWWPTAQHPAFARKPY